MSTCQQVKRKKKKKKKKSRISTDLFQKPPLSFQIRRKLFATRQEDDIEPHQTHSSCMWRNVSHLWVPTKSRALHNYGRVAIHQPHGFDVLNHTSINLDSPDLFVALKPPPPTACMRCDEMRQDEIMQIPPPPPPLLLLLFTLLCHLASIDRSAVSVSSDFAESHLNPDDETSWGWVHEIVRKKVMWQDKRGRWREVTSRPRAAQSMQHFPPACPDFARMPFTVANCFIKGNNNNNKNNPWLNHHSIKLSIYLSSLHGERRERERGLLHRLWNAM